MPRGYTLIELLVVVTIIAIISIMVFANYRGFSKDQVLIKATGQIQSLIKLAQSNASSGLKCASGDIDSSSQWYVKFINRKDIKLYCLKANATSPALKQTLTLDENIFVKDVNPGAVSCKDSSASTLGFSDGGTFTVSFKTISGEVKFFLNDVCEPRTSIATVPVTVQHTKTGTILDCSSGENVVCRTFNINRGGVVDAGQ